MNRRYAVLVAAIALGALAVGALARLPRGEQRPREARAEAPRIDLSLEYAHGRLAPESAAVPKGHRVRLRLANRSGAAISVRLAGYDDRVRVAALAPGDAWTAEFLADLPGDDFAWLVNDQPAGRLAVTGSHLIEGHR